MSFTNLYYKRTTATPKACFVCYKPTTTVLATINTTDFLYTCTAHLTDPGFATAVSETSDAGGNRKPASSPEEIAKVKAEWEERQKQKKEKEEAKEKEKEKEKQADKDADKDKDQKGETKPSKAPGSWSSGPSTPTPSTPTHQRFTLHRDYFAMRLSEHRKRRQATQAKELAPRLPGAPRGELSDSV